MTQDKLKLLLKPTMRFMRAAGRLVDAANARNGLDAGSKALARANAAYEKADAEYDAAHAALDELIEDLQD